ncbi:hypothetical protein BJ508DRAFT_376310 [Ascobolus immersus RN42]|uniref:Uncharacterized protein n=1 Tax=Ascobolus immersus RN42 TaxID=1160509 RepID=A0A3N4I640_ASCIM|nr:hypothetical protein BJ508DRAFT_376310 [Ascobolus immersus RN42]
MATIASRQSSPVKMPAPSTPKGRRIQFDQYLHSDEPTTPSGFQGLSTITQLSSSPFFTPYTPTPKRKRDPVDPFNVPSDVPTTPSRRPKVKADSDVTTQLERKEDEDEIMEMLCEAIYWRSFPPSDDKPDIQNSTDYPRIRRVADYVQREYRNDESVAEYRKELLQNIRYERPVEDIMVYDSPGTDESDWDEWDFYDTPLPTSATLDPTDLDGASEGISN